MGNVQVIILGKINQQTKTILILIIITILSIITINKLNSNILNNKYKIIYQIVSNLHNNHKMNKIPQFHVSNKVCRNSD